MEDIEEIDDDPKQKDQFGATKALRYAINRHYEIIEVLGKGSYGCVSKARCKNTGRIVALKIMENQTDTEYDTIKLVREIQLMRKLNKISKSLEGAN
jgi:serine/threonine protein kinase